jgi:hypothetical protein
VKAEFDEVNRKMAEAQNIPTASVFSPGEDVRDFRAG